MAWSWSFQPALAMDAWSDRWTSTRDLVPAAWLSSSPGDDAAVSQGYAFFLIWRWLVVKALLLLHDLLLWGFFLMIETFANATAMVKWSLILTVVPCLGSIDFVGRMVNTFPGGMQIGSNAWTVVVFLLWVLILSWQIPFWYWLFSEVPVIVTELLVEVMLGVKKLLYACLSDGSRNSMPSCRLLKAVRFALENVDRPEANFYSRLFVSATHVWTRWDAMVKLHPCVPLVVLLAPVSAGALRRFTRPAEPWTVSPLPCHGDPDESSDEDGEQASLDECPEHDTCGICLDNLCISARKLRRHPAYSEMCQASRQPRSAQATSGRRRREASPGHPVARSIAEAAKADSSLQLATLRCGHQFHLDCIRYAHTGGEGLEGGERVKPALRCPTCRANLETGQHDLDVPAREEDGLLIVIGIAVLLGFLVSYSLLEHRRAPKLHARFNS